MKVLVACEYSGVVRDAFRRRGHWAMSCDLLPTDVPGPHYQGDVRDILDDGWDLMVGHPECTYLCNSGAKHLYAGMKKENGRNPSRWEKMRKAADFYNTLLNADIERICLENPIFHGHAREIVGQHTQIIQPWMFGHKEMKATGLRLKNLPKLTPSNVVGPPPKDPEERKKWAVCHRMPPGPDRWKLRSATYPGIGDAMAEQWGNLSTIPSTHSPAESRDHTALREAGTEYPKGHDAQLAPQQPGPGGRRVLPGSAT